VRYPIEFRYGPDGVPFHLLGGGAVVDGAGRIPFHGIISRGLLERMRQTPELSGPWEAYGHLLHDEAAVNSKELARCRRTATLCGVLSFAQSAACVRSYVERYVTTSARCEVWNVKEGHTSSVWRVRLAEGNTWQEFAVNVARDRAAGKELKRTSQTMRRIAQSWPEANLTKVFEIASVRPTATAEPVVVTRNEWIRDSYEIHRLHGFETEPGPLVLVERFLTEDSAPSRIRRLVGRRLNPAECEQVERDLREFLERAAQFAVQVDINEGDLVWNGQRALVIAIR
jgi:hypothetical protein